MLARTTDERERIVLLQHAIDGSPAPSTRRSCSRTTSCRPTVWSEDGRPVTAEGLGEIYFNLLQAYYGDALDYDELSRSPGRGSRTSTARRTTSTSTPRALRRARS
jgi:oligoendopeptidase F